MREPIDDARVAGWTAAMPAIVFATITAIPGGLAIHALMPAVLMPYDFPSAIRGSTEDYAWVGVVTTALVAAAAASHARNPWRAIRAVSIAGVCCAPITLIVLTLAVRVGEGAESSWILAAYALCGTICSAPLGLALGWCFGMLLWPVVFSLSRVSKQVTITTVPRALCAAALWCALGLSVAAAIRTSITWMHELAVAGAAIAWAVVVGVALEVQRRRRLAWSAEHGVATGWRVERDGHGTRWLLRETHAGGGAYREGVVRTRWGRLDA
ncbi:hypothetical protein [Sandaracinus amylolyticus]|uniref:Uncharacterized protein n=1 Tax=Sandaracinus amylolyticus TaxID=927083 RepID=A0A0F6WA35_9BACT|nr:hypothetical protein [Sandaracinus amylolyticus]AKF11306.1 hypothetical protein DB32_008455 [Sandaracinus amylolyticus]